MYRCIISILIFGSVVPVFGADKLQTGLSNLASSLTDLARFLPKKAGGGKEEEPAKRSYAEVKELALNFLAGEAAQGKKFADEDAIFRELNHKKLNPDASDVNQATKTKQDEQDFKDGLALLLKPANDPARVAYVFAESLSQKLASVETAIRNAIRSALADGVILFKSVEDIREIYGKQIESSLPQGLSALLEITAVNDHLRKYVGMDRVALAEIEKAEPKKMPVAKPIDPKKLAEIERLIASAKNNLADGTIKKKYRINVDDIKSYFKAEEGYKQADWPAREQAALEDAIEEFVKSYGVPS